MASAVGTSALVVAWSPPKPLSRPATAAPTSARPLEPLQGVLQRVEGGCDPLEAGLEALEPRALRVDLLREWRELGGPRRQRGRLRLKVRHGLSQQLGRRARGCGAARKRAGRCSAGREAESARRSGAGRRGPNHSRALQVQLGPGVPSEPPARPPRDRRHALNAIAGDKTPRGEPGGAGRARAGQPQPRPGAQAHEHPPRTEVHRTPCPPGQLERDGHRATARGGRSGDDAIERDGPRLRRRRDDREEEQHEHHGCAPDRGAIEWRRREVSEHGNSSPRRPDRNV